MASLLTSGSIRIVVAGMFDGMAVPFLVYRGATITTVSMRRARHRERPLRVVALERLGEVSLVELAAAATLDPERGGVGREALDQPVAHGVGGLEADAAAPRAFAQGQHEHEALGVGHPGLLWEPARPQDAPTAHAEGPAAAPAEVALIVVPGLPLLRCRYGPAATAAFDFVGGAGRVVERRRADHVPDGLDHAAALGPAQLRHVPFEGDYQVLGVHATPIVSVYGANDMAQWGHMYASPGLIEPNLFCMLDCFRSLCGAPSLVKRTDREGSSMS